MSQGGRPVLGFLCHIHTCGQHDALERLKTKDTCAFCS